jgi:hypothetical protein
LLRILYLRELNLESSRFQRKTQKKKTNIRLESSPCIHSTIYLWR